MIPGGRGKLACHLFAIAGADGEQEQEIPDHCTDLERPLRQARVMELISPVPCAFCPAFLFAEICREVKTTDEVKKSGSSGVHSPGRILRNLLRQLDNRHQPLREMLKLLSDRLRLLSRRLHGRLHERKLRDLWE